MESGLFHSFDVCFDKYFCAGIDEVDYSLYPDKKFQMKWLRCYLTSWRQNSVKDEILQEEIEDLYKKVNKFALVSKYSLADYIYLIIAFLGFAFILGNLGFGTS